MADFEDEWPADYGPAPAPVDASREALDAVEFSGRPFPPFEEPAEPLSPLPLLDMAELASREPSKRQWKVDGWIPLLQATYLTGAGSAGKSLLAQQLCTCVAMGVPFLGIEVRASTALYVTCEDNAAELERRQKDICAALGVSRSALVGKLHLASLQGEIDNELVNFDARGRLIVTDAYRRLEATAGDIGAGFVALDNVAHLTPEEIARSKVAGFVNLLNRLALKLNGAVLFLGHPNKVGQEFSGSTAWENQVRARLYMEEPKTDTDPDLKALTRAKSNYARKGGRVEFRWYHGAFVRDDELPPDTGRELADAAAAATHNIRFMACLKEMTRRQVTVSNAGGRNFAPLLFSGMNEAKGSTKADLAQAMERLFATSAIERGELPWRTNDRKPAFGLRETRGTSFSGEQP